MKQPVVRYVTPPGVSTGLAELCARLGGAAVGALEEGRLFVDRVRATADVPVEGDRVIDVYARREETSDVVVLHEQAGLVFASKPPGVPTEPDHAGSAASVVARLAVTLGVPQAELHALSRLDVGVSGVVTLARTPAGRALVTAARKAGRFERRYLGLAVAAPDPEQGLWSAAIARGPRGRRETKDQGAAGAQPAATRYQTVGVARPALLDGRDATPQRTALLALGPVTGRTHQLRAHAASAGTPLLGDPSHGGPRRVRLDDGRVLGLPRVLLHAGWVALDVGAERLRVTAPLPEDFVSTWETLGGESDALGRALELTFAATPEGA